MKETFPMMGSPVENIAKNAVEGLVILAQHIPPQIWAIIAGVFIFRWGVNKITSKPKSKKEPTLA